LGGFKMFFLKGKTGRLVVYWMSLLFPAIFFYLSYSNFKFSATAFTGAVLALLYLLIIFWLGPFILGRSKNKTYKNYLKWYAGTINLMYSLFFFLSATFSFVNLSNSDYTSAVYSLLFANSILFIIFLFNRMYRPLGDNVAIVIPLMKGVTIQLNNLRMIVALHRLEVNKKTSIATMDMSISVLYPEAHWDDEYDGKDLVLSENTSEHVLILRETFKDNFYQGYFLRAKLVGKKAVLFELIKI